MERENNQCLLRLNNQQPIVTVAEKLNLVKVKKTGKRYFYELSAFNILNYRFYGYMFTDFLFCYSNQIFDFQKLKIWKFGLHLFYSQ